MITYMLDRIRISFGDSQCPLYSKCSGADNENDCCASHRGRNEIGGERAECYNFFKVQIRTKEQGLLTRLTRILLPAGELK
jgi:hypothetical protein